MRNQAPSQPALGAAMCAVREHLGVSQLAITRRVGRTDKWLSAFENGRKVPVPDAWTTWLHAIEAAKANAADRTGRSKAWLAEFEGKLNAARVLYEEFQSQAAITAVPEHELDDMNRRELLRILSMAGTIMVASLDWERLDHSSSRLSQLDSATIGEYEALNGHLWRVFTLSQSKGMVLPLAQEQLGVLTNALHEPHETAVHQRLCALTANLFQLVGEIFFDSNQYTDAAHCYTLAVTAAKEASAYDLWACAMTRHAFISIYEQQFGKAMPMLELAARLAHRGDDALSTRQWVSAVQAQAFAGLGELVGCERALDSAELDGQGHNGGWLRFDDSRIAEERGACFVRLRRPDLAEPALIDALSQHLSARRRGSVLIDLAMVGVLRRDAEYLATYAEAALELARHTGSGVLGRKLRELGTQLAAVRDARVRQLNSRITALGG
jgi:tetratricopeptide (TPR) repeat protein